MNQVISFDVGIVNLAIWIGHVNDAEQYVTHHWELVDLNANGTLANACTRLVDALHERADVFAADGDALPTVVIESQPDTNVKMKVLSHVIQTWFYVHWKGEANVKFVSARSKLSVYTKPLHDDVVQYSNAYRYRKDLSVAHTRELMKEHGEAHWLQFLDAHCKKDDLADAYLQGCHMLKRMYAINNRVRQRRKRLGKPEQAVAVVKRDDSTAECVVANDDVVAPQRPVASAVAGCQINPVS